MAWLAKERREEYRVASIIKAIFGAEGVDVDLESLIPEWLRIPPSPEQEAEENKKRQQALHGFFMGLARQAGEAKPATPESEKKFSKVRRSARSKERKGVEK